MPPDDEDASSPRLHMLAENLRLCRHEVQRQRHRAAACESNLAQINLRLCEYEHEVTLLNEHIKALKVLLAAREAEITALKAEGKK